MCFFNANSTSAEIVKVFPRASDLFITHLFDYCCGGDKPLSESFTNNNLDGEAILNKLNTDYDTWRDDGNSDVKNWDEVSRFFKKGIAALGELVYTGHTSHI